MWLVNMPKLRVVHQYAKGWVVEIQVNTWYGRKYWIHIESVSGMENEPWYYLTKEQAIEQAVKHFKWDLLIGTRDNSIIIE